MQFRVDAESPLPLYAQLERSVRAAIATGELAVGDQLPTVRQLAVDLSINANTVARVYAELEREGVLATQRGVGTFVRAVEKSERAAARKERERELDGLVERVLAEANALGFSAADLIHRVSARSKEKD